MPARNSTTPNLAQGEVAEKLGSQVKGQVAQTAEDQAMISVPALPR